jgi:hypothetical protein
MRLARIAKIILLGIVLVSTVACGSTPEFVTYTDNTNGYSMSIPTSWDTVSWGDAGTFYGAPSQCSGGDIMADVIAKDTHTLRLQTLYEAFKNSAEDVEGFAFASEEETTIDGIPAMKLMYMYADVSTGDTYQEVSCLLLQENTRWSISFWCVPECWDTYEGTFNTMLNSFHLLD